MSRQIFVAEIETAIEQGLTLSEAAAAYFLYLKEDVNEKQRPILTENGSKILAFMQENETQYNNVFKAKDIGEGLFISSRSVSGAMQKLIKENFCEKIGGSPVCYKITELGKSQNVDNSNSN